MTVSIYAELLKPVWFVFSVIMMVIPLALFFAYFLTISCISLSIGTNGKPLEAISKFPNVIGKLMIDKTLAVNGEEITNAMIGNDVLAIY